MIDQPNTRIARAGDGSTKSRTVWKVKIPYNLSVASEQAILASLTTITGRPVTLPEEGAPPPELGYWGSASIVVFSDSLQLLGLVSAALQKAKIEYVEISER